MALSIVALAAVCQSGAYDAGDRPLLMRHPTMNATTIAFEFGGDVWAVPKEGGRAIRLTASRGQKSEPLFSPDGRWLAFTSNIDGNADVYVEPATGGQPVRLTAHPGTDNVVGWTPDSKSILLASAALSSFSLPRLFTVPITGGVPQPLPLPSGSNGSFSPDGMRIAYVPMTKWQAAWKRYRGGQASRVFIAQLSDSSWKEIPRRNEEVFNPMWVGDKIYYLSDPKGPVGIYSYAPKTGRVVEEVAGSGFDVKSASAGPGGIVYEKLGSIHVYDPANRTSRRVKIEINGEFPEARPQNKDLSGAVSGAALAPSGQRLAVIARGMLFSVPATKGHTRQLTEAPGVDRRDPSWSPDGRTIAYLTDERGKQELALRDLTTNADRFLALGDAPSYYENLRWSPDGTKISYTDRRHTIWFIDVKTGANRFVDRGLYTDPTFALNPRWSPDSKWLTWSRDLDSHMQAVFLYGLDSAKVTRLTDGLANASGPVFDHTGKYLYFHASTLTGQALSWLDMSNFNQPNDHSSLYAVLLKKDLPNPLQPESDEEPIKEEPPKAAPTKSTTPPPMAPAPASLAPSSVDIEGIERRIIALPAPTANYALLDSGASGGVLALALPDRAFAARDSGPGTMWKFDFASRSASPFASGVVGFDVSADGSKALIMGVGGARVVTTMAPSPPSAGVVSFGDVQAHIDPKAEWTRMFHLVWRNEKLLLYDANLHGIDADAMDRRYAPFLPGIVTRAQLNYLFTDMLGEISIGHMFIGGGDTPESPRRGEGLLGADYAFENHRYRITRVFDGERWNPRLRAPLAEPGVNAKPGEYLLAVEGKDLTELNDVYLLLEGKAGKQVKVKLGPNPDGRGSREVTVVPVASEFPLRSRAWSEDNRRRVAEATNGEVGYVHVPDTATGGWTEFNRYYYAQIDRKAMIVDERFNGGGLIANFMIDEMLKPLRGYFTPRYGKDWPTPGAALFGPKVLLANEMAGSGGDMFPWLFRDAKLGPIIGKRTWGGLVAAAGFTLPDGGSVRAPDCAFYNPNGTWDVEGWGVSPDIEVEYDPYLWRQGKDAQLERAIAEVKARMKSFPYPKPNRPKPADKTKLDIRY